MVRQCFARGRALDELSREQEPPRFGTRVHFWPDPEVFGSALRWDRDALQSRLEQLVALREGFSCRLSCALLDFEVELDASRGLSTLAAWQPDRFGLHEGWIACEASEGPARAKLVLRWEKPLNNIAGAADGMSSASSLGRRPTGSHMGDSFAVVVRVAIDRRLLN